MANPNNFQKAKSMVSETVQKVQKVATDFTFGAAAVVLVFLLPALAFAPQAVKLLEAYGFFECEPHEIQGPPGAGCVREDFYRHP